jgi:hypothetical protein
VTNKIISDLISILAVVFLAMSVSPSTELVDKGDYWIIQQWKWIRTFDLSGEYKSDPTLGWRRLRCHWNFDRSLTPIDENKANETIPSTFMRDSETLSVNESIEKQENSAKRNAG